MKDNLKISKDWHIWFMLVVPSAMIGMLIILFAVVGTQFLDVNSDQISVYISSNLPVIIGINHIVIFGILVYVLKKNSLKLRNIGWRFPSKKLAREILIGIGAGLVFYLFKELVYDSFDAVLNGRNPTFTSLFNFHFDKSDLPMIGVATSLIFVEESIFRGFGIKVLLNRFNTYGAAAITSIFFGLLHWGNGVVAIIYTAILGLFFAGIFLWRDKNLIPGTIAHGIYNLLILLT